MRNTGRRNGRKKLSEGGYWPSLTAARTHARKVNRGKRRGGVAVEKKEKILPERARLLRSSLSSTLPSICLPRIKFPLSQFLSEGDVRSNGEIRRAGSFALLSQADDARSESRMHAFRIPAHKVSRRQRYLCISDERKRACMRSVHVVYRPGAIFSLPPSLSPSLHFPRSACVRSVEGVGARSFARSLHCRRQCCFSRYDRPPVALSVDARACNPISFGPPKCTHAIAPRSCFASSAPPIETIGFGNLATASNDCTSEAPATPSLL